MTDKRIALTTAGSRDEAHRIAHALVERRAAACVNIVGEVQSVYRWKDVIENASEWLLIVKTTEAKVAELTRLIREMHSYELPEVVVLSIDAGEGKYLDWIAGSVGELSS